MGLLDGLLGGVLGGMMQGDRGSHDQAGFPGMPSGVGAGGLSALLALGLSVLQQHGGLEGVLRRMQQAGYGRQADSWVGTGANEPISPDALSQIFGRDSIDAMARQAGMSPQDATGGLASIFPEIVNQMTPHGRVEAEGDDLVAQALEALKRKGG